MERASEEEGVGEVVTDSVLGNSKGLTSLGLSPRKIVIERVGGLVRDTGTGVDS